MAIDGHLAGDGVLWIQPDGPNTAPVLLGCHLLGDVAIPRGDLTLRYCPDPRQPNLFKPVLSYRGEPGPATTTITTYVQRLMDYLEEVACPLPIYVHKRLCGRADTFTNYDRSFIFTNAEITNEGLTGLVAREPGDQTASEQSFDIASFEVLRVAGVTNIAVARQSIGETQDLLDIAFCNDRRCASACGAAQPICDDGFVVGQVPAGSPGIDSDVWYTNNGGGTWAFDGNPFAVGEDVSSAVCFQVGRDTTRWIVARGTTDALNPAEIAYSDDGGTTWTNVNVGTTNGQYVIRGNGLFALNQYHIWCVTTGGYIYFSADGGLTWTAQESGVITTNDFYGVHFIDEANGMVVGASDTVLVTTDGGNTWTAGTATGGGDDLLCVWLVDSDRAWVGADEAAGDQTLYYTTDGGVTWNPRTFAGSATGNVEDIQFVNEHCGWMIHDTAAPVGTIFRTIDGGYNWEALTMPATANTGLNALWACDCNTAFAVGNVVGGLSYIVKAAAE